MLVKLGTYCPSEETVEELKLNRTLVLMFLIGSLALFTCTLIYASAKSFGRSKGYKVINEEDVN
ncbi:hypothetical protein HK099_004382 [Clydaea vesicula]|uniref:Transmembrane protein n=1 Tax=Clydaea vesicula TaxID=447962 RepID=A0AAD5XVN1_9FUNG|nr:hypothetical protein HK099_004382 [Clydaea vesicula]